MNDLLQTSPGKKVIIQNGKGPSNKLCILLTRNNGLGVGLGDHVQSLPIIYELIKLGHEITIYANEFYRSLYERAGCEFHGHSEMYFGITDDLLEIFGSVYSMIEWSFDSHTATRGLTIEDHTTAFAKFFGIERPKEFDFVTPLGAVNDKNLRELGTIIYAPQSSYLWRNLARDEQIYYHLKQKYSNILWVGIPEIGERRNIDDFTTLVDLIYNAKAAFTVDNGIMHLACALGVPMFGVFGGTDEAVLCEPYNFYLQERMAIRSYYRALPIKKHECSTPCWWQESRGFHVNGKCKEFADCMMDIDKDHLISEFNLFFNNLIKE